MSDFFGTFSMKIPLIWPFNPRFLALIGVINDLEIQCIGIELGYAHVLDSTSDYLSIFHQCRIYLEPFQNRNRNRVWTYFRFYKVTWPAQKWGIVTREVRIVRKSFYTPFRWENRGFIGFIFMFLPKHDRKVVKNEKNQKKAIAFFFRGCLYLKNG